MQRATIITITFIFVFVLSILSLPTAHAQTATPVQCGTTVQGEFTKNSEDQSYTISVKPGYQVNVIGRAIGDALRFQLSFFGPTWIPIVQQNGSDPIKNPSFKSGVLSARGEHTIIAFNRSSYEDGGVGVYTLQIECLDENGRSVTPAATPIPSAAPATTTAPAATAAPATPATPADPAATATPEFSGVGFPGLPPVDFKDVARVPLPLGTPVNGAVGPRNNEILGFTLNTKANERLELSYTRVSGNLNLGLVVLSSDNKVFFQTSLVTSSVLTTTLTLPTSGQYTVGVFRINLVEPTRPEATAFELQARLRGR